jgi:AraC-like DNA-binding protein
MMSIANISNAPVTTNHILLLATRGWEWEAEVAYATPFTGELKMNLALPSSRFIPRKPSRDAILTRLLSDAVEALERDTERARTSLFRAVAMVEETPASASGPRRGGLASLQAKRALAQIDEHLAESGTRITELAAHVRLSQSHFSRAFKEFFGRSPQRFILERRIERAKERMLTTDDKICDVALACGFADQAHFCRMFHKLVGLPPNAWRRGQVND